MGSYKSFTLLLPGADNFLSQPGEIACMKTKQFFSTTARRIPAALFRVPRGQRSTAARRGLAASLAGLAMTASLAARGADYGAESLTTLAAAAVSAEAAEAEPAIAALRARGPAGLQTLLETHDALLRNHADPAEGAAWLRLKAALDAVGQQRDCYASKLYWFTDLGAAQAAARASGKPILSLRLLGKLDEEFSCANSRFFRTTLYANAEVSQYLREHFILHWKSVRPAPRVTIDFGDGRKLERTITGNSIHYVLGADGRVMDALPGLYGAQAFLSGLQRAEEIARQCASCPGEQRDQLLREFHRGRLAALQEDWAKDMARLSLSVGDRLSLGGPEVTVFSLGGPEVTAFSAAPPTAQAAARLAVGKSQVEVPLLRGTVPKAPSNPRPDAWENDDGLWPRLAALHADSGRLDEGAKALVRAKGPDAAVAGRLA